MDFQELSTKEQMEEFVFLGLRKMEGISEREFTENFSMNIEECYGHQIEKLLKEGLLQKRDGRIMLTRRGIDISNYAFAEFLN